MKQVQSRIRLLMAKRRMTVADLAARSGRPYSDVRRSLREPHWWRIDRLLAYADALEIDPAKVFPSSIRTGQTITGTPDLDRARPVMNRMIAASHAGAAVKWMNEAGVRSRRKHR